MPSDPHTALLSIRSHNLTWSRFFPCHGNPRDLHSFPTRRSSDLGAHQNTCRSARGGRRRGSQCRNGIAGSLTVFHQDRKSTRLNSSHRCISYAVFCLKKKTYKDTGGCRQKQDETEGLLVLRHTDR